MSDSTTAGGGLPDLRQQAGYPSLLLGAFTLLAATLLVFADRFTREPIAARAAEDLKASLAQVIPLGLQDNDPVADAVSIPSATGVPVRVYRAMQQGRVTAVAFQVTGLGYAGPIELILGLDAQGRILGARVLSHRETPGLGDRIEATKDDWILGFTGLALGDPPESRWAVRKDGGDFDQFSGATITPRAVVGAFKRGLQLFATHRAVLLTPASGDPGPDKNP